MDRNINFLYLIVFLGLFACCIVHFGSSIADAEIITVDDDGGADFTKIQDAINASTDGDVIMIYAGIYWEDIIVNKSISLIGNKSDTTTIISDEETTITLAANNTNISYISASTNYSYGKIIEMSGIANVYLSNLNLISDSSSKISIQNCNNVLASMLMFDVINGSPLSTVDLLVVECSNISVMHCRFFDSSTRPMQIESCENITIKGNVIKGNNKIASGVVLAYSKSVLVCCNEIFSGNSGVHAFQSSFIEIENNSMSKNELRGVSISRSNNISVNNNAVTYNDEHGIRIYKSDNVSAENNTITFNLKDGIYIYNMVLQHTK